MPCLRSVHVPGSSGSAVTFTGSRELQNNVKSHELGESVRKIFEQALALGIRVAMAFDSLRRIHSESAWRHGLFNKGARKSAGEAVCWKSMAKCCADHDDSLGCICPRNDCMRMFLCSRNILLIIKTLVEEMTALASIFGPICSQGHWILLCAAAGLDGGHQKVVLQGPSRKEGMGSEDSQQDRLERNEGSWEN